MTPDDPLQRLVPDFAELRANVRHVEENLREARRDITETRRECREFREEQRTAREADRVARAERQDSVDRDRSRNKTSLTAAWIGGGVVLVATIAQTITSLAGG